MAVAEGWWWWQAVFYNAPFSMTSAFNCEHSVRPWDRELGFSQIGVAGVDLSQCRAGHSAWLAAGFTAATAWATWLHGGLKQAPPSGLVPGTVSVITAAWITRRVSCGCWGGSRQMPWPDRTQPQTCPGTGGQRHWPALASQPLLGTVSVYARGATTTKGAARAATK